MTLAPRLDRTRLRPGMRVAVGVSGGADSVALLRTLADAAPEIGLLLSVVHVHHGIRGIEADADAEFVEELAERLGLSFLRHDVDTPSAAREGRQTIEEAARTLRYGWFRELLAEGNADAVATAHTLDDQAETVLHRLLRGAWTEGLGGIHPVILCEPPQRSAPSADLAAGSAVFLRPFLEVRRTEIEAWLQSIGQPWRNDATNADTALTRNRIRHELLPQLATFNPRIAEQLARMAEIARDEEAWWDTELARLLPGLLLPGKPVRGGGRAVSTHSNNNAAGIELERLRALAPALRRRVLRAAAQQLGCAFNFDETERLMAMLAPDAPRKQQFAEDLRAERTARELRLIREAQSTQSSAETFVLTFPGEVTGLGVTLRATLREDAASASEAGSGQPTPPAVLRTPRHGDRVQIAHSRGPKPLKEIFERMGVAADQRKTWPVVEWQGRIVWMQGVVVQKESAIQIELSE